MLILSFLHSSRISDRGGGIPHAKMGQIFEYGYTTSDQEREDSRLSRGMFGSVVENRADGIMHGYVMYSGYGWHIEGGCDIDHLTTRHGYVIA